MVSEKDSALFSIIYELDNKSPKFAFYADRLLSEGRFGEAKEILEKGLTLFPDYLTAHIIYSLCLAHLGMHRESEKILEDHKNLIYPTTTYNYYSTRINEIMEINSPVASNEPQVNPTEDFQADQKIDIPFKPPKTNLIYTETYAKILANQGKIAEATEILKELQLRNPEKRQYFDKLLKSISPE